MIYVVLVVMCILAGVSLFLYKRGYFDRVRDAAYPTVGDVRVIRRGDGMYVIETYGNAKYGIAWTFVESYTPPLVLFGNQPAETEEQIMQKMTERANVIREENRISQEKIKRLSERKIVLYVPYDSKETVNE